MPKQAGMRDDDLLARIADLERRADRLEEDRDSAKSRLLALEHPSGKGKKE